MYRLKGELSQQISNLFQVGRFGRIHSRFAVLIMEESQHKE